MVGENWSCAGDGSLPSYTGVDLGSGKVRMWDLWVVEPDPYFPYPLDLMF